MSGTVEGLAKEIVSLDVASVPELSRDSHDEEEDGSDIEIAIERALQYNSEDQDLEPEFYQEWEDLRNEWTEYLEGSHK